MKLRLTETQIREIVRESLNEFGDNKVSFPPGYIQKKGKQWAIDYMSKEYPDLDPSGFVIIGDTVRSNGKKRKRRAKIIKPEGMTTQDYLQKMVLPNNPVLRDELEEINKLPDIKWVQLNAAKYCNGDASLEAGFKNRYFISNYGHILDVNPSDGGESRIRKPYANTSSGKFQKDLRAKNAAGTTKHLNNSVGLMVRDHFSPEDVKFTEYDGSNA